ncbi:hypothetical protein Leryth_003223 [Lithospermum erythrorhizon]|nr:hypothetical protein Leryth_003223 [Lithospermum erythrorhizon]
MNNNARTSLKKLPQNVVRSSKTIHTKHINNNVHTSSIKLSQNVTQYSNLKNDTYKTNKQ